MTNCNPRLTLACCAQNDVTTGSILFDDVPILKMMFCKCISPPPFGQYSAFIYRNLPVYGKLKFTKQIKNPRKVFQCNGRKWAGPEACPKSAHRLVRIRFLDFSLEYCLIPVLYYSIKEIDES